jgi:hypothetical protein
LVQRNLQAATYQGGFGAAQIASPYAVAQPLGEGPKKIPLLQNSGIFYHALM